MATDKAVVFDLFHTLISLVHTKTPGPDTHEILGFSREVWVDALFHRTEERLTGRITDYRAIIRDIADKIKPGLPDELVAEAADSREQRFRHSLKNVQPEILEILQRLKTKGVKTALLSNADKLERCGWEDSPLHGLFDIEAFSCDIGFAKPQKESYLFVSEKLGKRPENCFFVGDGGSDELNGARKAGMIPVFTSQLLNDLWPERVPERAKQADYHIRRLEEVLAFF